MSSRPFREDFIPDVGSAPAKIEAGTFIYENVAGTGAAVSYLETLGNGLALEEGSAGPGIAPRLSVCRHDRPIREYEATLSRDARSVAGGRGYRLRGSGPQTRLSERVPTFCFNLPCILPAFVTETMLDRGIGSIRDGHMYALRSMKHLGQGLDRYRRRSGIDSPIRHRRGDSRVREGCSVTWFGASYKSVYNRGSMASTSAPANST